MIADERDDEWATYAEAARAVRVNVGTLRLWVHRGLVRHHRIRHRVWVHMGDVRHAETRWATRARDLL